MAFIKILLTGDTGTGKSTIAAHMLTLERFSTFRHVAMDHFRLANTSITQEYDAKLEFVQQATLHENTIIECSGVGLTSSLLLSGIRDLIDETPLIVIPFFFLPKNSIIPQNRIDPRHALITFREFNPVTITHTEIKDRMRVINRIFKRSI